MNRLHYYNSGFREMCFYENSKVFYEITRNQVHTIWVDHYFVTRSRHFGYSSKYIFTVEDT